MNPHDKFMKVENQPGLGWKDYTSALVWAVSILALVAMAL